MFTPRQTRLAIFAAVVLFAWHGVCRCQAATSDTNSRAPAAAAGTKDAKKVGAAKTKAAAATGSADEVAAALESRLGELLSTLRATAKSMANTESAEAGLTQRLEKFETRFPPDRYRMVVDPSDESLLDWMGLNMPFVLRVLVISLCVALAALLLYALRLWWMKGPDANDDAETPLNPEDALELRLLKAMREEFGRERNGSVPHPGQVLLEALGRKMDGMLEAQKRVEKIIEQLKGIADKQARSGLSREDYAALVKTSTGTERLLEQLPRMITDVLRKAPVVDAPDTNRTSVVNRTAVGQYINVAGHQPDRGAAGSLALELLHETTKASASGRGQDTPATQSVSAEVERLISLYNLARREGSGSPQRNAFTRSSLGRIGCNNANGVLLNQETPLIGKNDGGEYFLVRVNSTDVCFPHWDIELAADNDMWRSKSGMGVLFDAHWKKTGTAPAKVTRPAFVAEEDGGWKLMSKGVVEAE